MPEKPVSKWREFSSARISAERARSGLKDKAFGEALGHSRTAVRQWESGSLPGSKALIALRALYGKSIAWWLGDPDATGDDDDDRGAHTPRRQPNEALAIEETVCAFLTKQVRLRAAHGKYDALISFEASKPERKRAEQRLRGIHIKPIGVRANDGVPPAMRIPKILEPVLDVIELELKSHLRTVADSTSIAVQQARCHRLIDNGATPEKLHAAVESLYRRANVDAFLGQDRPSFGIDLAGWPDDDTNEEMETPRQSKPAGRRAKKLERR
jgi:transcriptional regulator with XRE-family HTH domain